MNQNTTSDMEELYAKLTIEDEEEGGVIIGAGEVQENKENFVLVGRFLTEKNINFQAMQNVLASLWRPKEGMEVHDLGNDRYSFVFYHIMDLQKVIEGGPWSFEQNMLVYKQLMEAENPRDIQLNEAAIWVQVYDLPKGFISENILKSVGDYIGKFMKADPANYDGTWKAYVRIRIMMNVLKPLKRRMKIKREGGSWIWINFKYERLSTFCFVCGMIGHTERECSVIYANAGKEVERAYGVWLRAPTRGVKNNSGSRWLRTGEGRKNWSENGGGQSSQTAVNTEGRVVARFQEIGGVVRETWSDGGAVTITAKNQETKDMGDNISNIGAIVGKDKIGPNIVVETKRKRTGEYDVENGPIGMQTDGLDEDTTLQQYEINVSKNLNGAGPVDQARLEL